MNTCRVLFKSDSSDTTNVLILKEGEKLRIGRSPSSDGSRVLAIPKGDVSSNHAEISFGDKGWSIVDLGSKNGTSVGGKRLEPEQPCQLEAGDQIKIAGHEMTIFTGLLGFRTRREPLMQESLRSMVQVDVTVLVAEIRGEDSAVLDEKDITEHANTLRTELYIFLADAITSSGGHFDRFDKNTIVAWWNLGIPYGSSADVKENGEIRACKVAIKLRDFAQKLASKSDAYKDFSLLITLATGRAAGGNFGQVLYDNPDRLMFKLDLESNKPETLDAIIVDKATYDLVDETFRLEEINEAYVEEGAVQPEGLFKLVRARTKSKSASNAQDTFRSI